MLKSINTLSDCEIKVDNVTYPLIHVDTTTLDQRTVKDKNGVNQKNEAGVYIFVLNNDYDDFQLSDFQSEVTGIFFKGGCPYTKTFGTPQFNNEKLRKDCIFYVGTAGNILSRIKEHWKSSEINGCVSLKLGFETRSKIKDFLDLYLILDSVISSQNSRQSVEKDIRKNYGSVFGE